KSLDDVGKWRSGRFVLVAFVFFSFFAFYIVIVSGAVIGVVAVFRRNGICHRKVFTLENATTASASILNPDVIALHVVFFIFEHAAHGIDDAAVGSKRERGDVFVDGLSRFINGLCGRRREKHKES